MKELSEYIAEQLKGIPTRNRLFDIGNCMESDTFTVEGLKLDFKIVRLNWMIPMKELYLILSH